MVEAARTDKAIADPAYRVFVSYIDKSREFYGAQGFERPYRWARNEDAPFTPLAKPLSESRLALVTTTTLLEGDGEPDPDDRPPKRTYASPLEPFPDPGVLFQRPYRESADHPVQE